MITKRTLSIALLVWRTIKLTEGASERATSCVNYVIDVMSHHEGLKFEGIVNDIQDHADCKEVVLETLRVAGVALATLRHAQRQDLRAVVAILLIFKFDANRKIAFSELPDVLTGLAAIFGLPIVINQRIRGADGRYVARARN